MNRFPRLSAYFTLAVACGACLGNIGGPSSGGGAGGGGGGGMGGMWGDGGAAVQSAIPSARFARLSHVQWENSVEDLFGLTAPTGLAQTFTADPLGSGFFDNDEDTLLVTPGLWADYQRAAEQLAAQVTADGGTLGRFLPSGLPSDPAGKAQAFVTQFGRRIFRRPLSPDEVARYVALFNQGTALTGVPDAFTAGVRLTLQGMLQSPNFVYRVESSTAAPGVEVPLNGYEVATRLSYMLFATTPSPTLLDAAAAGQLSTAEGVAAMATKMLEDPRSDAVVKAFHRQLFNVGLYPNIIKDPTLFPDFTASTRAALEVEHERFVHAVVFDENAGLSRLLTAPYAYVNQATAPLYGLAASSFGSDFRRVDLDASQRAGILNQAGFLAYYGTETERQTIRRGAFVNLRILCANLPPPPGNVPPLPAPDPVSTDRERVTAHTGPGTCGSGCHAPLINPIGFGLEHFDAAGKFVTTDHGKVIDSSGTYAFDGKPASFVGAPDMMALIASSTQAHHCYAKNWLQFALGRSNRPEDEALLGQLTAASLGGASVKSLLVQVATSKALRYRAGVKP